MFAVFTTFIRLAINLRETLFTFKLLAHVHLIIHTKQCLKYIYYIYIYTYIFQSCLGYIYIYMYHNIYIYLRYLDYHLSLFNPITTTGAF